MSGLDKYLARTVHQPAKLDEIVSRARFGLGSTGSRR